MQSNSDIATCPLAELAPADPSRFEQDCWQPVFARLRNEAPVHLTPESIWGPYWSVTRYHDILEVDKDFASFSSETGGITIGDPEVNLKVANFIRSDPPTHGPLRKVVSPTVAPRNLAELAALIRTRAATILDDLPVDEEFDWVPTVSVELTTQMLATLFDFPFEERHRLTYWSDMATASPLVGNSTVTDEARHAAAHECLAVFTDLLRERREWDPAEHFDFVTRLAHGEATRDMPPMQVLGMVQLLIIGGNDTTRNSISGGVLALNQFPAEYRKLRDNPALVASMVPEIIRWQTPLAYMRRTATKDVTMHGKTIRAGEKVIMWYISGNRDERAIDEPDQFIIDRANPRQHLSFGFGIHRCMGNRLAEMQLRIVWEEILKRFHTIEVTGEPERTQSNLIHGITSLPVRVHPH